MRHPCSNSRGSIVVNRRMQTGVPGIYAVGDAVEVRDYVRTPPRSPLPVRRTNRGASRRTILRCRLEYGGGARGSAVLKIFDMTAATTGLNEKARPRRGLTTIRPTPIPRPTQAIIRAARICRSRRSGTRRRSGSSARRSSVSTAWTSVWTFSQRPSVSARKLPISQALSSATPRPSAARKTLEHARLRGRKYCYRQSPAVFWHDVQSPASRRERNASRRPHPDGNGPRQNRRVCPYPARLAAGAPRRDTEGQAGLCALPQRAALYRLPYPCGPRLPCYNLPAAGGCTSRSSMSAPFPNIYVRSAFKAKAAPAPLRRGCGFLFQWQLCPPQLWLPQPCSPQACSLATVRVFMVVAFHVGGHSRSAADKSARPPCPRRPSTPPNRRMPAAASAACAPPPMPPQMRTSICRAASSPASAPCPLPLDSMISEPVILPFSAV